MPTQLLVGPNAPSGKNTIVRDPLPARTVGVDYRSGVVARPRARRARLKMSLILSALSLEEARRWSSEGRCAW